jgi:hypothetical protein
MLCADCKDSKCPSLGREQEACEDFTGWPLDPELLTDQIEALRARIEEMQRELDELPAKLCGACNLTRTVADFVHKIQEGA